MERKEFYIDADGATVSDPVQVTKSFISNVIGGCKNPYTSAALESVIANRDKIRSLFDELDSEFGRVPKARQLKDGDGRVFCLMGDNGEIEEITASGIFHTCFGKERKILPHLTYNFRYSGVPYSMKGSSIIERLLKAVNEDASGYVGKQSVSYAGPQVIDAREPYRIEQGDKNMTVLGSYLIQAAFNDTDMYCEKHGIGYVQEDCPNVVEPQGFAIIGSVDAVFDNTEYEPVTIDSLFAMAAEIECGQAPVETVDYDTGVEDGRKEGYSTAIVEVQELIAEHVANAHCVDAMSLQHELMQLLEKALENAGSERS